VLGNVDKELYRVVIDGGKKYSKLEIMLAFSGGNTEVGELDSSFLGVGCSLVFIRWCACLLSESNAE
tara:strand:- start:16484 stop:16684 length:201 start_codon:yes stop_codon:yes gene_type:complete